MSSKHVIGRRTAARVPLFVASLALIGSGAIVGLSTSGASAATKHKTVTLQFWSTYNTADKEASTIAKVIIPRFEKLNPGIKVNAVIYPYSDLLNKFITTSAAGNPPDVMRSDIGWVAQLAQEGIIENVTKLKAFAAIRKESLPGPLTTTEVGGKFYAFPDDTNTQATGHIDSAATITAVQTLVNLLKAGDIGSDFQGGASAVSGESGFPKGEYAMYIDGPWAVPTYAGLTPVPSYGIAAFPSGVGGSVSTVGGEDTVVAKDGHHVTDAEKFAAFLDSPFAQLAMAKQGDMSAIKSDSAQEVKATPSYAVFAKQLLTARIRANSPGYSQLDTDWSNELQQILAGTVTVAAGLAAAAQQGNTALAGS